MLKKRRLKHKLHIPKNGGDGMAAYIKKFDELNCLKPLEYVCPPGGPAPTPKQMAEDFLTANPNASMVAVNGEVFRR